MLQEVRTILNTPSRCEENSRWRKAVVVFSILWVISISCIIFSPCQIISVQALILLNTAASFTAAVVTYSHCSRAGNSANSPFVFGLYRLSTVIRFGSIIFLVFGCVETVVESLHSGAHGHHSNPLVLFILGSIQLISQAIFCRDARLLDRVIGHHGMAGAQSEDILHEVFTAAYRDGCEMGGECAFGEYRSSSSPSGGSKSDVGLSYPFDCKSVKRTVHNSFAALLLYLLCPAACIFVSVLMFVTNSATPDVAGALLLAAYYAYVGCRQGREMLNLLMNRCVSDTWRLRTLEGRVRNVKMLDGVLHVQSTVWWNINVSESMLLVRVRLMSGSDARAVSRAVREHLTQVAKYVYVECFSANGASGFGDSAHLPWIRSLVSTHTDSHGDHGHSHDCSHNHHHMHSHSDASHNVNHTAVNEVTCLSRQQSNMFSEIDATSPPSSMGAPGSYGRLGFPEPVPPLYTNGAPVSLTFPQIPSATNGASDSFATQQISMWGAPTSGSASQKGLTSTSASCPESYKPSMTAPPPSTEFPYPPPLAHSGGGNKQTYRMDQSAISDTVAGGAHSAGFPAPPSSRLPDKPPSVFIPYQEVNTRICR